MTFNWNIRKFAENLIPEKVRKEKLTDWIYSMISPVKHLYDEFYTHRLYNLKRVRFNGQVIVLENLLNDLFDDTLRRIRILTVTDMLRMKYIYQHIEAKPQWLYQNSENNPLYIHRIEEYSAYAGFDFIVEVPVDITDILILRKIKNTTHLYRLAGKYPKFIWANGNEF